LGRDRGRVGGQVSVVRDNVGRAESPGTDSPDEPGAEDERASQQERKLAPGAFRKLLRRSFFSHGGGGFQSIAIVLCPALLIVRRPRLRCCHQIIAFSLDLRPNGLFFRQKKTPVWALPGRLTLQTHRSVLSAKRESGAEIRVDILGQKLHGAMYVDGIAI